MCLSPKSATSLPISGVPGVRYGAMGTLPMNTSISGIMHVGGSTPATANAVACGGWQWTVATARGWRFMICRCIRISLVRFFAPAKLVALQVHQAQVLRFHEALGHQRRRAERHVLADANGDVAAVAIHIGAAPEAPADVANLQFERVDFRRVEKGLRFRWNWRGGRASGSGSAAELAAARRCSPTRATNRGPTASAMASGGSD